MFKTSRLGFAAALGLAVVVLWPVLSTGWFGDDAFLSSLPAAVDAGRFTLLEGIARSNAAWLQSVGRITPLHTMETYVAFDVLRDRVAYKAFIIVLTVATIASFAALLGRVAGARIALVVTIALAAMLQIRGYHDPYLAYSGSTQIVGLLLCWSLFVSCEADDSKRPWLRWIALVVHVASCLTYEVSYLFAPIYTAFASVRMHSRAALRATAAFYVVDVAFIALAFFIRTRVRIAPDNPYATGHDAVGIVRALASQLTSSLPLSYAIADPSKIYSPAWLLFGLRIEPLDVVLVAVFAVIAMRALARTQPDPRPVKPLVVAGALLAVVPALPLALVVKYQNELRPGLGYLPVFLQAMGVALLAGLWIVRMRQRTATFVIAAIAIVIVVTAASNRHVAAILAPSYRVSRQSFDAAVTGGLIANVASGSALSFEESYPWVCTSDACIDGIGTSDHIWSLTRKRIRIVSPGSGAPRIHFDAKRQRWTIDKA